MQHIYLLLIIIIGLIYLNLTNSNTEKFATSGGTLIQLMTNASGNGNYPYYYTKCGNYKKNNQIYDIKPYDNKKRSI